MSLLMIMFMLFIFSWNVLYCCVYPAFFIDDDENWLIIVIIILADAGNSVILV